MFQVDSVVILCMGQTKATARHQIELHNNLKDEQQSEMSAVFTLFS